MTLKATKDGLDVPRLLRETTQTHSSFLLPHLLFFVTQSSVIMLLLHNPNSDPDPILLGFQFVLSVSSA